LTREGVSSAESSGWGSGSSCCLKVNGEFKCRVFGLSEFCFRDPTGEASGIGVDAEGIDTIGVAGA
jgi:hypothetical protein